MTTFQTCYVAADGKLYESSHDDTDCITYRIAVDAIGWWSDLVIDQNGVAWINGEDAVQTTGAFCAALHPTAPELYVQRGNSGFVDVYNFADFTTPTRSYTEPYVAQAALLRVNPDGTPLMNTSERNGRVVAGVALSGWIEERGWIAGLADNGLPGGCVFLQKPDGSAWMWSPGHDIQRPIELAVSADGTECWIAVSDVNPPKPSEIVSLMVPYLWHETPKPAMPSVPAAPATMPSAWVGIVGPTSPADPGNCSWGFSTFPDTRPTTDMASEDKDIRDRPYTHGLWLSDNHAAPETVDPEIAYTKARGATAVYLHCDAQGQLANVAAAAHRVTAAGLTPLVGLHVNHGWPDTIYPFDGLTLNVRTFGKDMATLRDGVVEAIQQMRLGHVQVCYIFGWYQGGVSLDTRWPELATYLRIAISRIGTPEHFPGWQPPVITPPVIPTKPPIVLVPKRDKDKAQILGASAGIAGAIIGIWQWLRRKRKKKQEAA